MKRKTLLLTIAGIVLILSLLFAIPKTRIGSFSYGRCQ